jgi:DNA-3-methyladenine glycosylase I
MDAAGIVQWAEDWGKAERVMKRCNWPGEDPLMMQYHDTEWGVPKHDDGRLFESLVLDGAQAGLSWTTILRKRENYRKAFDGFDPEIVARYDDAKVAELLSDAGIVRNRQKIASAIENARALAPIQEEFGSFAAYVWGFVGDEPIKNARTSLEQIPAKTEASEAMSKDLRKRGFKFVGPTICYAFMQAEGLVNDHMVDCFRYDQV